jgi:hypothetical protein
MAPAFAQQLELPRPSPLAKVSQMVGITEVAVEYSSPAVKGRKVFGGVVPFGQLWRTGANVATKLTVSKDVTIADQPVAAGSYAVFTIPNADSWTFILNKNTNQGGTQQYKQELDVLRVVLRPMAVSPRERLAFIFSNTTDGSTSLDLEWENVRLSIPIKAATDTQVLAGIKAMSDGAWRPFNNAARYLLDTKRDYDEALRLVDKSLSLKEDWFNLWTKAQLLSAKGKAVEACALAQKSRALGGKAESFFIADDLKKALADWRCH